MGFRVWGLGCRIQCLGPRVRGLGFRGRPASLGFGFFGCEGVGSGFCSLFVGVKGCRVQSVSCFCNICSEISLSLPHTHTHARFRGYKTAESVSET